MKEIPNSRNEKAIIKASGMQPSKKVKTPDCMIFHVKPANMDNNIWPLKMLADSLRPSDIGRAKQEINSIITNKGSKPKGQPAGINKEKNSSPYPFSPNIVAPKTMLKLRPKAKLKWLVEEKL